MVLKNIKSYEQHSSELNKYDENSNFCRQLTAEDYITTKNIDKKLIGEWAIFRISSGHKFYISSLYKKDLNWNETKLKYSDESTLKLTKEFATKLALINKESWVTNGIVNDKGVQIILTNGNEIII